MLQVQRNAFRSTNFLGSAQVLRRSLQTKHVKRPPLGFAFDIDGVLMGGPEPLPKARNALRILNGNNPLNAKIPYILLTNGGGHTEYERAQKLSSCLDIQISPSQIIQAHTILKDYVDQYADKAVLCLGGIGDTIRKVAESYGYRKAFTTTDVLAWNSSIWPFIHVSESDLASAKPVDFSRTPISAIFVFHDPRNWGVDVQIMCDVLQSGGLLEGPYLDISTQQSNPIQVVFCNPDLLWKSDFPRPRLGQGAFKASFEAVYKMITGSEYPYVQFGKPTRPTYDYARRVLQNLLEESYGPGELPHMYMIGDNPESDIAGANAAGWSSILVHTGVYDPTTGPPTHIPSREARDVEEAVIWALESTLKLKPEKS
ncbi:HAD-like domain-containing protein [Lentinula aff. lateritia]|uniref:HAD-like domain-containing protein n=1 Tax=Lentinula aff. lateritia TaxID=2804960 RepID=A0ACC1U0N4_9AGAR|nr:HAD-like domain-containing protein [Lentinula aff. lateritia]